MTKLDSINASNAVLVVDSHLRELKNYFYLYKNDNEYKLVFEDILSFVNSTAAENMEADFEKFLILIAVHISEDHLWKLFAKSSHLKSNIRSSRNYCSIPDYINDFEEDQAWNSFLTSRIAYKLMMPPNLLMEERKYTLTQNISSMYSLFLQKLIRIESLTALIKSGNSFANPRHRYALTLLLDPNHLTSDHFFCYNNLIQW